MSDSAKKYTIAVIPGDGIGKEVTLVNESARGLKTLN